MSSWITSSIQNPRLEGGEQRLGPLLGSWGAGNPWITSWGRGFQNSGPPRLESEKNKWGPGGQREPLHPPLEEGPPETPTPGSEWEEQCLGALLGAWGEGVWVASRGKGCPELPTPR